MNLDALAIRRALGKRDWRPPKPFPSETEHHGWVFLHQQTRQSQVIVSEAPHPDPDDPTKWVNWIHASMTRAETIPSYDDLVLLHAAVFGERYAYQVFAPPSEHVNIHARALHLWGREDGKPVTPTALMINGRPSI